MVNAFELITDIVQVINARPNKAKNSYYKALDSRTGVNGKIPLVRISNIRHILLLGLAISGTWELLCVSLQTIISVLSLRTNRHKKTRMFP